MGEEEGEGEGEGRERISCIIAWVRWMKGQASRLVLVLVTLLRQGSKPYEIINHVERKRAVENFSRTDIPNENDHVNAGGVNVRQIALNDKVYRSCQFQR